MTLRILFYLLFACSLSLTWACSDEPSAGDGSSTEPTNEATDSTDTPSDGGQEGSGDSGSDGQSEPDPEPPCSLLEPISTSRPSPELFEGVTHPVSPIRADGLEGPLPTNHFMGNILVSPGHEAVYVHPYVVKLNSSEPYGLSISHSDGPVTGGSGSAGAVQFYFNVFERDMGFAMAEPTVDTQIAAFDEMSVHLKVSGDEQASMSWPLVRGMAYVTAEYTEATPTVFTQHAVVSIDGEGAVQGATYTGQVFDIGLNNGDRWRLYVLGGEDISFVLSGQQLNASAQMTAVLRLAKVPAADESVVEVLDTHSGTYPVGVNISAAMHQSEPDAASYSFLWESAGDEARELLHYALPHHQDIITAAAELTDLRLRSTTKGEMQAYIGSRWTLREPKLTSITWLAPRDPTDEKQNTILESLNNDIAADFGVPSGSYYFAGKSLYKRALLCLLADEADLVELTMTCVSKLQSAMDPFVSNSWSHPLRYDERWGGIVSSAGLDGNAMADFGNSNYNDHHYHWGYFLQTAAILRHLDPAWGEAHNQWVEALIRDVSNPSKDDSHFPVFRSFDWFSGHSWSQGLFLSADGKDQESTSEEVNFHYGLTLWGIASGNERLFNLGRLMLAAASRSINTYFLMRDDNTVHPSEFISNRVTGIFFENKCDYATWFGSNREYIHGIQMLPVTPITEEVRYSDFVEQEWSILESIAPNLSSGWKSILYTSYATIEPDEAFEVLEAAPLDDGLTRTWALYWAATRPEPGALTRPAAPTTDEGYADWTAQVCAQP